MKITALTLAVCLLLSSPTAAVPIQTLPDLIQPPETPRRSLPENNSNKPALDRTSTPASETEQEAQTSQNQHEKKDEQQQHQEQQHQQQHHALYPFFLAPRRNSGSGGGQHNFVNGHMPGHVKAGFQTVRVKDLQRTRINPDWLRVMPIPVRAGSRVKAAMKELESKG